MFVHGKNTKVFFNQFDFSTYFNSASIPMQVDTVDKSTFQATAKSYLLGNLSATLAAEGFFDGDANAIDEELEAALGAQNKLWSVYFNGDNFGRYGYAMKAINNNHAVMSTLDDAARISAGAQSDGTGAERVVSLHALGKESASAWTGSGHDGGAASLIGGSAYLHVTGATGTIEVKLQHATTANFSDAADLATFTSVTGATAQRIEFSGTVNRYVRGYATIGAGEEITFQLGFYRKIDKE